MKHLIEKYNNSDLSGRFFIEMPRDYKNEVVIFKCYDGDKSIVGGIGKRVSLETLLFDLEDKYKFLEVVYGAEMVCWWCGGGVLESRLENPNVYSCFNCDKPYMKFNVKTTPKHLYIKHQIIEKGLSAILEKGE